MVDVRVVDSNGKDVASDGTTVGEVVVRGKTVFTGYMETSSESLSTVSATQSGSETTPNAIMVAESGQEEVLSSQASTTQDEAAGVGGTQDRVAATPVGQVRTPVVVAFGGACQPVGRCIVSQ